MALLAFSDAVLTGRSFAARHGYGVRLQFYYQSLGQLKKCFPDGQDQTLVSNVSQIFFGVNDLQTAEYVSNRLGEGTIVIKSGGTGTGTSHKSSMKPTQT